jgi:hypothetical protein
MVGAGLGGISLGMHGDETFRRLGIVKDEQTGASKSITGIGGELAMDAANLYGGPDTVAGQAAAAVASLTLAVPGAQAAVGSAALGLGRTVYDTFAHLAD